MSHENPDEWKAQGTANNIAGYIDTTPRYFYIEREGNRQAHMSEEFYKERRPIEYNALYRESYGESVQFDNTGSAI